MHTLLLIEDDIKLAQLIQTYLRRFDFTVTTVARGDLAMAEFARTRPHLVILDLMLPGRDGLALCRDLRESADVPILMLTASAEDQVTGLELGADDYVIKPVEPRVLLARVRALLRRPARQGADPRLCFGALVIDPDNRAVALDGAPVELSTSEFELLALLARHAGQVLSRDAILNALRGIDFDGLDRSVDVTIGKLRRKLGDDDRDTRRIKTVWGKGYLFSPGLWG
ncbi:MAG: winged helix-turn-helix domain-containing protein [Rhodocyclales bacterium]|nr:winged helix-turn-helix domain-containing protein [Rhodocyclales bacterium]